MNSQSTSGHSVLPHSSRTSSSSSPTSLIIRFATSHPDLPLSVADPALATPLSLLPRIRAALPDPYAAARIRLIYAGRTLPPTAALAAALRLPAPDPFRAAARPASPTGKAPTGKGPIRHDAEPRPPAARDAPPLYIHAAFAGAPATDATARLAPAELAAERDAAARSVTALLPHRSRDDSSPHDAGTGDQPLASTAPAPQGFDRLLAAGLTGGEVAQLRAQFVARLAHTRTPEEMPGAAELRAMEEAWLDADAGAEAAGGGGATNGGGAGGRWGLGGADEESAGLEDMLWGNVLGFFWPVGAVVWAMREEGVWSRRRQMAIVTGLLVNAVMSLMRTAG